METELSKELRSQIANEILPFLKLNPELYQPKRVPKPTLFHSGKIWLNSGAKMQGGAKDLTVSELMELSDNELLELQRKVVAAKAAKQTASKQSKYERFFLK